MEAAENGGSGGTAAVFYQNIFYWPTQIYFVSISLKVQDNTEFKIYLDKQEFEKNDVLLVKEKIFAKNNMVSNDSKA